MQLSSGGSWGRGQPGHQGQERVVAQLNTAGQRLGLMCGPVKMLLRHWWEYALVKGCRGWRKALQTCNMDLVEM